MTINSISIGMNATQWGAYTQKLTKETRLKLQELHIPFNESTTEVQARSLISQYIKNKNANENFNQTGNQNSKNDTFEQAKNLAKKLGINAKKDIQFEDLIAKIETVLEEKIASNSGNIQELNQLREYGKELSMIQSQVNGSLGLNASNQVLEMSLEMLSQYNKNFLNK